MTEAATKQVAPLNCQERKNNLPHRILCLSKENIGLAFSLENKDKEEFEIGRSQDCDFIILHPSVSGKHCIIEKTETVNGPLYTIKDTKSTNGTYVNGGRVPAGGCDLRDGDVIGLGRAEFLYKSRGHKNCVTTQKTVVQLDMCGEGEKICDLTNFDPFCKGRDRVSGLAFKIIIGVTFVAVALVLYGIIWEMYCRL